MYKVYEGMEMYAERCHDALSVNNHLHNNHLHNNPGGSNNGVFFGLVANNPNRHWRRRDGW